MVQPYRNLLYEAGVAAAKNHSLNHHPPVCCSCTKSVANTSFGSVFFGRLEVDKIGFGEPPAYPCSACIIRSRSGINPNSHRKSLTGSQLLTPGSVRVGRPAVFAGSQRECTLFWLLAVSRVVVTCPMLSASRTHSPIQRGAKAVTELSRKTTARLGRRARMQHRNVRVIDISDHNRNSFLSENRP
jgi:hypothetical protein